MQPLFVAVALCLEDDSLIVLGVSPDARIARAIGAREAFDDGGLPWIFFGFIEGGNGFCCLRAWLLGHGLSDENAVTACYALATFLEVKRKQGVIFYAAPVTYYPVRFSAN